MGTEAPPCLISTKCIAQRQPWIGNKDTQPAAVSHTGMRLYRNFAGFNFFCARISHELAPPKPLSGWSSVWCKKLLDPRGGLFSAISDQNDEESQFSYLRGTVRGTHIHPLPSEISRTSNSADSRAWFLKAASSTDSPHCTEAGRSWGHCGDLKNWEIEIKKMSEKELNKPSC